MSLGRRKLVVKTQDCKGLNLQPSKLNKGRRHQPLTGLREVQENGLMSWEEPDACSRAFCDSALAKRELPK